MENLTKLLLLEMLTGQRKIQTSNSSIYSARSSGGERHKAKQL